MNRNTLIFIVAGLLTTGPVSAQSLPSAPDESRLQATQQEMDEDAAGRAQKTHAEILAKQYKVDTHVVENLRAGKQGWGEIGIRLVLAQELTKADPKTYPTMTEALQRIADLRAQKLGWGAIANQLGVNLGQLVSQAQQVRQQIRAELKNHATGGAVKPGQAVDRGGSDKAMKAERVEPSDRPQRPERPERPQRPERPERPDRPGKS